jgi:hypothetical protein
MALGRSLSRLLVDVTQTDVPTLAAVSVVVGVVAAVSIGLPVRRAVRSIR